LFTAVEMAPRDPILGLNEQFAADTNPNKVNLGVGVYFDDNGKLPLLKCVQTAEKHDGCAQAARLPAHRRHGRL
jgi:aromatic-amino-acid transaminase